jgi:membrane protein YdbS with pleckstrin-like domain
MDKEKDKTIIHLSLAVAMKELYKISNRFVYWSYCVQALLFGINIFLILVNLSETNSSIWTLLAFSIFVIILSISLIYKSKKYYELGENVRKMDMIERIFPNAANSTSKSYLISSLPSSILEKAKMNPDEKTDYYSDRENKYEKLIENIQQNCYFTSEIMRSYSALILSVIIGVSVLLAGSIIYGFFILSESSANQVLSKSIAGYLALLINFIFTLNIIDHYILFDKKAKELKKIDESLNLIKNNPHEDEIITSFTEYNCILCDALPCPDFAYNRIKNKLNLVWENRVNND